MIAAPLLRWYAEAKRDLPWRRTRDPWAKLVSEIMLQQTQVATVVPYYERFIARWPTPGAFAAASEEEVLKAWEGLGYYRRARHLHAAAKALANKPFPRDVSALRALPGVGEYTAAAVAAIAFGARVPVVDGNVERVATRCLALPADRRAIADRLAVEVPVDAPGDFAEALMDLGATVCLPRNPRCDACPLAEGCVARATGSFPAPRERAKPKRVEVAALLARREDGAVALERRGGDGLLAGFWTPPLAEGETAAAAKRALARATGATLSRAVARHEHAFTHRRWRIRVYEGAPREGYRWAREDEWAALPLSGPAARILGEFTTRGRARGARARDRQP
ncbi:MAG TPA: A/G-specific adenine glycosylase [Candidatus Thermoplasmatota archaeon]|nr:A/G-specific adenine glycosylase [Candidatus Thermoplasmatota archaeon]